MFLEQLSKYAKNMKDIPPPMYQRTPIRYMIYLDESGNYVDIAESIDSKGRAIDIYEAPYCKRSSGVRAKLLVDNGEYVLGIGREKSDPRRVQEQHQAFVTLVHECADATHERSVEAVAHFLNLPDIMDAILQKKPDFDPASNVGFKVANVRPFELQAVQVFWAKKASAAGETDMLMQCLVCGEWQPPVERLPIVIKGIPGGQSMGLTLISGNAPAFESYGLTASLIAPTCETCGERFGNALNELLRKENTHIILPPLAYVFWVRHPSKGIYDDGIEVPRLMNANPEAIKNLYRAPWYGNTMATNVSASQFYAATLSASGARVVLRDWLETPIVTAQEHLKRFFWLQRLYLSNEEPTHFPLRQLVSATMHQKTKNQQTQEKAIARVGASLMHVALHGGRLPDALMCNTIQRIRATRKVRPEQAALIKMVLLSKLNLGIIDYKEDRTMATPDENERHPAYLCGRLLAELDYIQYRALGRVNATIADRFYGTASTAPAIIFPRLLKGAIPHLASLRAKVVGDHLMSFQEKDFTELAQKLSPAFPAPLSLEDQGRFALGFFFQRWKHVAHSSQKSDVPTHETFDKNDDDTDNLETYEEE